MFRGVDVAAHSRVGCAAQALSAVASLRLQCCIPTVSTPDAVICTNSVPAALMPSCQLQQPKVAGCVDQWLHSVAKIVDIRWLSEVVLCCVGFGVSSCNYIWLE